MTRSTVGTTFTGGPQWQASKVAVFGLVLPPQLVAPLGTPLRFQFVKRPGRRALIAGFALIAGVAD